jgi:hypothetical protein
VHIVALLLAIAVSTAPRAQTAESGTISGHVKLTTRVRAPLPSSAYPTRTVAASSVPTLPEIRNVVMYLRDVPFRGPLPVMKAELRQENETFIPHVVAVTKGSWVDFPNDDPFFHNVFSLSSAGTFNLGRYPRGQTRARQFNKPGLVKVYCDIHSHMSASILVLNHPYFAIPALDGTFELPDVPPGRYTLVGWHERVGERAVAVRVENGKDTSIELTVPVEDMP